MPDKEALAPLLTRRSATVLAPLERTHRAQGVRPDVPYDAGSMRYVETIADAIGARVKQGLPGTVAVILHAVARAAIGVRAIVDITEPCAVFERKTADPFVLDLRERLYAQIGVEVLTIREALNAVIAFSDGRHTQLKFADSSRNADVCERAVILVEHDA